MSKKVNVYGLDGEVKSDIELPDIFEVLPRFDLIKRAVLSSEMAEKQPQGRDPAAGKKNTAKGWNTGFAVARVPRLKGSGYPGARAAAFVPMAVGGRVCFAPTPDRAILKKSQ